MNVSSIYGTQWQSASGLVTSGYAQYQKQPLGSQVVPAAAASSITTEHAGQMAAAIAAAMAQLGLTASLGQTANGTTPAQGNTSATVLPGSRQVRQYKDMASTFSSLARALESSASGTSAAASQPSGLTSTFQNLWTSLGATPGTSTGSSGAPAIPSLPAFLQSLASNFGESGISGLRGVFVDTVA
ncbi:hypothetical protein IHE49_07785 [Rhodanobacter sp. 7MK24]|uniref:hypothetical protein n=1 Tax=Rhodanobacter sp. 7MK24 TaxID=2775922 RepID=UPI00178110A4|nr:hypothetical protein [Rhodanobacter sp. 7MK24]MBD8880378.1 hypothetical protein [Rhodanobacter sp. 7MK24]